MTLVLEIHHSEVNDKFAQGERLQLFVKKHFYLQFGCMYKCYRQAINDADYTSITR